MFHDKIADLSLTLIKEHWFYVVCQKSRLVGAKIGKKSMGKGHKLRLMISGCSTTGCLKISKLTLIPTQVRISILIGGMATLGIFAIVSTDEEYFGSMLKASFTRKKKGKDYNKNCFPDNLS